MIQPPPFPNEYPRGHVIRGFVTWSSVSEKLSKTSIGSSWPVVKKLVRREVKLRSEGSGPVVEE
jgi:hypothetical protein